MVNFEILSVKLAKRKIMLRSRSVNINIIYKCHFSLMRKIVFLPAYKQGPSLLHDQNHVPEKVFVHEWFYRMSGSNM